jgi:hypothetical protein
MPLLAPLPRDRPETTRRDGTGASCPLSADRARIDYKRWQALEKGRANPTLRTLIRIAEALETDFWALMRGYERRKAGK